MTLDTEDKGYIETLFDRNFDIKMGHYVGLLTDIFDDRFKMLTELLNAKPSKEEVDEKIEDSVAPIRQRVTSLELKIQN